MHRRTFAEFFAGIGLMRVGLERAGWAARFANDIDPMKARAYRAHFGAEEPPLALGDVHALDAAVVPTVHLATASFPCNDLSLAGGRAGLAGKESSAYWGFLRVLEAMGARRPPLVMLENVPGFLTSNGGRDLHAALLALNALGYAVDAFFVDAAAFVPQSRRRLFIVGSRYGNDQRAERAGALGDFIRETPEIRWRVRSLPPLPVRDLALPNLLDNVPPEAWWAPLRTDYLLSQMSERHRALADAMIAAPRVSYGTVFRRVRLGRSRAELRVDGVAGCLRTPRGGSGRQILLRAGNGECHARLLTPRECARLMGADDYIISGTPNQALFGFGDAVCVPVIAWIAENYLNPLCDEEGVPS